MSMRMTMSMIKSRYDVVILGAGHNGLVAASYLGARVLVYSFWKKTTISAEPLLRRKSFPITTRDCRVTHISLAFFPRKLFAISD